MVTRLLNWLLRPSPSEFQEDLLPPALEFLEFKVPPPWDAEWDGGAEGTEERAPQRFLQRPEGSKSVSVSQCQIPQIKKSTKKWILKKHLILLETNQISMCCCKPVLLSGGHAHSRSCLHVPEAPPDLHSENLQPWRWPSCVGKGREEDDAAGGFQQPWYGPVRSDCGLSGCACGKGPAPQCSLLRHEPVFCLWEWLVSGYWT